MKTRRIRWYLEVWERESQRPLANHSLGYAIPGEDTPTRFAARIEQRVRALAGTYGSLRVEIVRR